MVACKCINGVDIGSYWQKVIRVGPNPKFEGAEFPDVEMYFLPLSCQHCANPECVAVCPTGASQKLEDGTIQIDKERCIGCQFCVMACPYHVRYLNETEGVVEKCTLCKQLIDAGELPKCVPLCSAHARFFGDLEQGIESFEGPEYITRSKDNPDEPPIQPVDRIKLGEFVEPFDESQVYYLPNVGNGPSFAYILRDRTWRG